MVFFQSAGQQYARFEQLSRVAGLAHAVSCRPLDLSPRQDERAAWRADNRARMARDLRLSPARLHYCVQVHGLAAAVVQAGQPGGPRPGCDLIVTSAPGEALLTFSADCPLLLACDPVAGALGLAHASWRCTVGGIATRLVQLLAEECGARAERLLVGIGPSAGPCCYEVREDVLAAAAERKRPLSWFRRESERMFFDLWSANRDQLTDAGIPLGNIEVAGICTLCRNDTFYSYRREGAGCGHFGLMAALISA